MGTVRCRKCRSENPDSTRFCGHCGSELHPSGKKDSKTKTIRIALNHLSRGSTIAGRYEVIEELGEGGMGTVYRVFDNKLDGEVALKLLKPEIDIDEQTIERFRNELKIARKVAHRNVCRMFDIGEDKDNYYIVMEYIPGENLKQHILKTGSLTSAQAISIAKQVCRGLAEAHRLGIVHRDLKPQNIMIDDEGNVSIMDFGIARSLKAKKVTESGVIIGTLDYISPEQIEGMEADHRTDIYSLGVILFEIITGKLPFEGDTVLSIAYKHVNVPAPSPRELNAHISEDLSAVILKCMEKDRERRYQKAEDILTALENIEKKIPISPESILEQMLPPFIKDPKKLPEIKKRIFVARESELLNLDKSLREMREGKGKVLFISGEAGTGKTALVTEFAVGPKKSMMT